MSSSHPIPVRVFVVVSFPFTFSLEESSGFSSRACATRQREFLASLNPRTFVSVSRSRGDHSEPPLCTFRTGVIPEVVVSHPNSSRTERFPRPCVQEKVGVLSKEKQTFTGARGRESAPLPRGREGTEPLSRTHLSAIALGGLGHRVLVSLSMRHYSGPGVLETLNPTDDVRFGNGRNTNGSL